MKFPAVVSFLIFANLAFLLYGQPARAGNGSEWLFVGAGAIAQNMSHVSNVSDGTASFLGTIYPAATLLVRLDLGQSWLLDPAVSYSVIGHTGSNEATSKILVAQLPLGLCVGTSLELKFGPGVLFEMISAPGGTVTIPGDNQSFYIPSGSSTASNLIISGGFGLRLGQFRADADFFMTGALSSTRRALNTAITVSYGIL